MPLFLTDAKPIINKIESFCKDNNLSRIELAMAYVKREKAITHLVFGVDSLEQLKDDIYYFSKQVDEQLLSQLESEFDDIDASIVMPSLWKK